MREKEVLFEAPLLPDDMALWATPASLAGNLVAGPPLPIDPAAAVIGVFGVRVDADAPSPAPPKPSELTCNDSAHPELSA